MHHHIRNVSIINVYIPCQGTSPHCYRTTLSVMKIPLKMVRWWVPRAFCNRTEYMVVKCFNWICSWAPRMRMCTILLLVHLACVPSNLGNQGRGEWGRNDEWRMTLLRLVVVLGRRSLRFLGERPVAEETLCLSLTWFLLISSSLSHLVSTPLPLERYEE